MKRLVAALAVVLAMPVSMTALIPSSGASAASEPSAVASAEIPTELLNAYMAAATTCPGLPWQVLAAIGWVESRHAYGRADPASGDVSPPIFGPPLGGRPGFALIHDPSQPDGFARAVGPMQFLATTWARWGRVAPDRPPGSSPDAQNAWDAIYGAAAYLCAGEAAVTDLEAAILRYNRSDRYLADVLAKATEYGLGGSPLADGGVAGNGAAVVAAAMTQLGVPYVWGAESPSDGFDCSGLVQWVYAQIGVQLPRTTGGQVLVGIAVTDLGQLRPGDLIFTDSNRGGTIVAYGHVSIYAGGGQQIAAPGTGDVVRMQPLAYDRVRAVRRVVSSS